MSGRLSAAVQVAVEQGILPLPEAVDGNLADRLATAERDNDLMVLLVDPLASTIAGYEQPLRGYDDVFYVNTGVVLVLNQTDRRDPARTAELRARLTALWPKKLRKRDATLIVGITSQDDFRSRFLTLLLYLQKLLLDNADISLAIDDADYIAQPQLAGGVTL